MSSDPQKVLIMDDESLVRDLLAEIFEAVYEGTYEVITTASGTEAVEAYKTAIDSAQPFDLIILDLVTPESHIDGVDTIKTLLAINAEVKVIASSGYSNDPVMANFKEYGFKGILPKPYKIEELKAVVKEVLLD